VSSKWQWRKGEESKGSKGQAVGSPDFSSANKVGRMMQLVSCQFLSSFLLPSPAPSSQLLM